MTQTVDTISSHCTHTHSNIHTNQTAFRYTVKYLKPILGSRYYGIKHYTHPPTKFSHNCEWTDPRIHVHNKYIPQLISFVGKRAKDGHYSKQALKHQLRMDIRSQFLSPTMWQTCPMRILDVTHQKPFPPKAKNQPLHTVNWNQTEAWWWTNRVEAINNSIKYFNMQCLLVYSLKYFILKAKGCKGPLITFKTLWYCTI